MKKKRVVSLLLVSAMAVGLFTGCGSTENVASGQQTQESTSAAASSSAEVEEPQKYWEMLDSVSDTSELPDWDGDIFEISIWVAGGTDWVTGTISEDNVTFKELERVTGIRFNLDESYGNDGDSIDAKMPKLLASKDFPTMITSWSTNSQMEDLYNNDYLVDLTPYYEDGTLDHVLDYMPLEIFGEGYLPMGEDGSFFSVPIAQTLANSAAYWNAADYAAPGYDKEYYDTYGSNPTAYNSAGYSEGIAIREDVLLALYPDALTLEEIQTIWEEKGTFTEDEIFDIGLESPEDFYQLLYDIQDLLKNGEFVGTDGRPMEVTFGPNADTDNWGWLKCLPAYVYPQMQATNYFSLFDMNETDPTKILKSAWETDYYQDIIKDLNKLVNDDVIAQNSLVDNAAAYDEKIQNGHYAVVYGQTHKAWNLSDPDGKWAYRPLWIKQDMGTEYNGGTVGYVGGSWAIFKDSVTDEQLDQLLHAIDYLWSEVGVKNFVWGPASAGLFEEDANGVRHYTDAEVEANLVYGEDNEACWKYGLLNGTCSTKISFDRIPFGTGVYLNAAKYVLAEELPRIASDGYYKFNPGVLGGKWTASSYDKVILSTNYNLHSYGIQNVEGLKQFWSARSGYENQLKKVVSATPDKFDAAMQELKEYCLDNGWTDEAMLEFNEKWVAANEAALKGAGMID